MNMWRFNIIFILVIQMILFTVQPAFAEEGSLFTPSGIEIERLENEIDGFMKKHIGVSSPGASVAVVKNGKIVFSKGYGYADIESNESVTTDTVFEYGSVSKVFVWTSVMQLVEQGKLDLDEDIKNYLPEEFYKKLNLRYSITLRDIMNHSSGFGEYSYNLIGLSDQIEDIGLADAILMNHPEQYYKPGTASVYSNYATALAAFAVENVSGEEFYKYQKQHIFEPLHMDTLAGHMKWEDNPSVLDEKAKGYSKINENDFSDSGWSYVPLYPAGSVIGTAEDLASFVVELTSEKDEETLLFNERSTLSTMLTSSYQPDASGTAHGLLEYDSSSVKALGHAGNTASFSAQFAFVPDENFGFVVLTNARGEMDITMGLHELLLGDEFATGASDGANLINAHDLEGNYASMRRPEGTPSEFMSYLSTVKIKAVDENRIDLEMGGLCASYIQTAPYQFGLVEASHPLLKVMMPDFTVRIGDDGKTENILFGNGFDLSALPENRTLPKLISNIATLIISLIVLIFSGINLVRIFLKRRSTPEKTDTSVYMPGVLLTSAGILLLANNIFLIFNLITNMFIKYESIKPMIIINYVISGIAMIFIVFGLTKWRKMTERSHKVWFVMTAIVVISLISLFANWNMYTIF